MPRLTWDQTGERFFETGVKQCVLYPQGGNGVAWNGITAVTETPSGAEPTDLWADDQKYLTLTSVETFGGTIEAYTYPDEFRECNGEAELAEGLTIGQQKRKTFGLCYRTALGNDVDGTDHGYKLHLVYNALAGVSERAYQTISDSPEAMTMSWEFTTTPVPVTDHRPTALLTIDSTKVDPEKLTALENKLYGDTNAEPTLPTPDEVLALISVA